MPFKMVCCFSIICTPSPSRYHKWLKTGNFQSILAQKIAVQPSWTPVNDLSLGCTLKQTDWGWYNRVEV
jgi:hypothetical protein